MKKKLKRKNMVRLNELSKEFQTINDIKKKEKKFIKQY